MAITKILYRNGGLAQAIQYITNPDKTDQCVLVDHFNCDPGFAYQQMMNTKRRFHKTDGRQCYHIIQSFKPDEITPELAHEIAKRFAAEHLRGYEAVIGTHVDKGHIHSHIVFNSVNADTGIKYHSTLQNYYQQIRGISDRLCAENGLSVILQGERTKTVSYIEWLRQSKGQPTFRSMLEADLRDAIADANDLGHFFLLMEHKGYEIHHGNRLGFRLRGQERYMYPERKNAAYSEENIERAIAGNLAEIEASDIHERLKLEKGRYILLSAHREENIDTEKNFTSLFTAINRMAEKYDMPVLYSCHPRSRKRLEASGFALDPRVIRHEPLGFHDYNCLQMNAFCVVSDSGTLPEESSFFTSIGHPFPAVCIRTSTERPEALDKACFILAGIDEKSLLQAVDTAVTMNQNGDHGIPVPDYVEENVSAKVVKIIQSYTGVVDKMVWRKF